MRIGFIGAGIISHAHAMAIEKIEEIKLVAVADLLPERLNDFAKKYNAKVYIDYKKMVKTEKLDAVVINLPHYLHKEAAVFCSEHMLHIMLEKPMANTVDECAEILTATKQSGVTLMVGHVQRYFSTMTCSSSNGHAVTLIFLIFHSFLGYHIRASNAT